MTRRSLVFPWFLAGICLVLCVLSFYRTSTAAPPGVKQPFANPIAQRQEIVAELKELNRQLREQNALLRSGKLQVVVAKKQLK